jgi:hypothetical protein
MIVTNFYFSSNEKWIEFIKDGETIKEFFYTDEDVKTFIKDNNLNLTYKTCLDC